MRSINGSNVSARTTPSYGQSGSTRRFEHASLLEIDVELLRRSCPGEGRAADVVAAHDLGILRAAVPELLQPEDRDPQIVVEASEELALELVDLRRDAVGEEGEVELPAVDSKHEVVTPVVRLVVVFVADAIGGVHERADELPRRGSREVARVDADVEVAPNHEAGDDAPDELNPPCGREQRLNVVAIEEGASFGLQGGCALYELVIAERHGRSSHASRRSISLRNLCGTTTIWSYPGH